MHDPNVTARIAEPDLFSGLRGVVSVEGLGRTELAFGPGPHEVMLRVDTEGYLDWVWERLAEAGF